MKKVSILDIPEDLLDDRRLNPQLKSQAGKSKHVRSKRIQSSEKSMLDALVTEAANVLGEAVEELRDWIKEVTAPVGVLQSILITAKRLKLNPLLGQIDWGKNLEGEYGVYIPIDGWISLIHRHSTFQGITFNQSSETENGIPIWMECSLFRSDLGHPITVREYYAELKTDHPVWQMMPRRMLRHKTLQQCARLAFGIWVSDLKLPITLPVEKQLTRNHLNQKPFDSKSLLREKLDTDNFLA